MRVLVADDDTAIRETICLLLRDEQYEVLEATNGRDALKLMRDSDEPLIVLLDMWMPGMSGEATLLSTLTEDHWLQRYGFIVITANPQHISDRAHALLDRYGIPLVVKPFDIESLSQLVASLALKLNDAVLN